MSSPTKRPRNLHPLSTNFHNRSFSSIASGSDAGTFHSAHAHPSHMELRPMSSQTNIDGVKSNLAVKRPTSPLIPQAPTKSSAVRMDRQDSGYSETIQPRSTRTSMSSTGRQSPSKREQKRRTTNTSINSTTRPPTKRASRSTPSAIITRTSTSPNSSRPAPQTRHTHGQSYQQQPAYQFFHFPTFTEPHAQEEEEATVASALVPPATVQYWTSDSTRRLEYAAIDAASKGVKGFFIKLVPDCILPPASRRPRFCEGDDGDSNLGSVRRYRLDLPEEKCPRGGRKGLWRRWSSGWGRRRGSC